MKILRVCEKNHKKTWKGSSPPRIMRRGHKNLRAHFRMKFRAALRAPRGGPLWQRKLPEGGPVPAPRSEPDPIREWRIAEGERQRRRPFAAATQRAGPL